MDRKKLRDIASQTPVILLAGGLGTRLSEETELIPKPMVRVAGVPIILHVMDSYARFGFRNFVVCGGYRIEDLRNFFLSLPYVGQDVEITFSEGKHELHATKARFVSADRYDWKVTVLETGLHSMTGARARKAISYLQEKGFERFCLTYSDGVCDVDMHEQLEFHLKHGAAGTVVGVNPPTRFGILNFDAMNQVKSFSEKPRFDQEFINGGFFIFEKGFAKYLSDDDQCILEREPLENLSRAGQLYVFKHTGFWQCMDTKREKLLLEDIVTKKDAPWLTRVP